MTAGFGTLVAHALLIPVDTVRDRVKEQIRVVTGLNPVLGGEVAVSLFPTGSVRFSDVSLTDKRAGTSAMTAEQLVIRLRFFPFLVGRIEIADVTLVRPAISINFVHDGSSNWSGHVETLARALRPSPDRVKSFSEIRITDGTVMLHDETGKIVETLSNVQFALAWPSISKSFAATGRFVWRDQPLDATLSLSDFLAALTGERSGLKLRLSGKPLKFAFDGYISRRPTLRMEGTLAADTTSLRDTLHWATRWASPAVGFERFTLKAQTNIAGRTISLSGANIELDGNVAEGVLTFTSDGRRILQGTLAAEAIDLTPYVSSIRLLAGNDWDRQPITLTGLRGVDVDLRLSAGRVTIDKVMLGRTAVAVNLRGCDLTVAVGESQAFGGVAGGTLGLAQSDAGAAFKAQMKLSDIDLEQGLGDLIGIRHLEGKGTLAFNLDSEGASVHELTQRLSGTARLASQNGSIAGINVEHLLKRLERNPLAGRGSVRGGKTLFDTLAVNLKVTQGTASVEDVRLEAPTVRLALTGSVSVPARDLNLKGAASLMMARDAAPTFELPFEVTGPWDNPLLLPDTRALIGRSGASPPLLDTMRSRLRRTTAPAPEPASPSPPANIDVR